MTSAKAPFLKLTQRTVKRISLVENHFLIAYTLMIP